MLLYGWPYDIHSFVDVVPMLAQAGYQVIVPYLPGVLQGPRLREKASRNMTSWNSSSPNFRTSPCPHLPWKAMPMAHHTRMPVPMPGNSRAAIRTGSSRAASGTICP